jgi:multidrug efflux pump subunit AcrB
MMGKIMRVIPIIVIWTLAFSLVESLLILPAHLSHLGHRMRKPGPVGRVWGRLRESVSGRLDWFVDRVYRPSLNLGLRFRYATLAWGVATLLLTFGVVRAGWIKFTFFPNVESDFVSAALTMPPGSSVDLTAQAMEQLEKAAIALRDELDAGVEDGEAPPIQHIFTSIGDQPLRARSGAPHGGNERFARSNLGEIALELAPSEKRNITSAEIVRRWRDTTEPIADATELAFSSSLFRPGEPVNVQLNGLDLEALQEVSDLIEVELEKYAGVFDITDSFRSGKREVRLSLKPAAEQFGITLAGLARQVRQAFYGEEAQRIQRGRDDVRVMVRYPQEQRSSVGDLENMRIRTATGVEVPFSVVAEAKEGRGFSTIRRVDRRRAINVTADVDPTVGNASDIVADLKANVLPAIIADYPGISYSFEGEQREQAETMQGLLRGFLFALLVIYALMAIPFRSYVQPFIVMSAIPFGFVGAVWGHVIMGIDLTMLSMFGLVALTGVVVNDSIVLVHFVNARRASGAGIVDAVKQAGIRRFRPIILTSATTFAGLTPLLLEKSMQAKFLVPMAVSLGFGVVFATFITLMIVPVLYIISNDVKEIMARLLGRRETFSEVASTEKAGTAPLTTETD